MQVLVSTLTNKLVFSLNNSGDKECIRDQNTSVLYHCIIESQNLFEGAKNKIVFSGQSRDFRNLEGDTEFMITRDSTMKLIDGVRLGNENGKLVISYKLAQPLPADVGIGLTISSDDPTKSSINIQKPDGGCNGATCRFTRDKKDLINFLDLNSLETKTVPIKFKIVSNKTDQLGNITINNATPLGEITMDLIQPGQKIEVKLSDTAVQNQLTNIADQLSHGSISDPGATIAVKNALNITNPTPQDDQTIKSIVDSLKQKKDAKNKFFEILKIAGRVGLAYFGIPIPIP